MGSKEDKLLSMFSAATAGKLVSSNRPTKYASKASWKSRNSSRSVTQPQSWCLERSHGPRMLRSICRSKAPWTSRKSNSARLVLIFSNIHPRFEITVPYRAFHKLDSFFSLLLLPFFFYFFLSSFLFSIFFFLLFYFIFFLSSFN